MANFNTHLIGATITSSITTGYLFNADLEKPLEIIPFAFLGVVGGLLPDIDSDNSTSARLAFNFLAIILPLIFFIEFKLFSYLSLIDILFVTLIAVFFVRVVMFWVFKKLSVHRGIFHSVPAGIMFGLLVVCVLQKTPFVSENIPLYAGLILFVGYITHLVLDELYAVNLAGLELKRSFGTALKFIFIGDLIPSCLLYLSIILLILNIEVNGHFIMDFSKGCSLLPDRLCF